MVAGAFMVPFPDLFPNRSHGSWPSYAKKQKVHLIGHGHIDLVWLWPWHEGVSLVHSTFRSVLDRMNENPDFTFVSSSAQFYQWVAENDPEMLDEIRDRVVEAGGISWVDGG